MTGKRLEEIKHNNTAFNQAELYKWAVDELLPMVRSVAKAQEGVSGHLVGIDNVELRVARRIVEALQETK